MDPSPLFAYMRERHEIYLRRAAGQPRPWTDDPTLATYRFCNVFRELDTTTIWFRENVRRQVPLEHLLLATVVFRWFNRITTGEAIFQQLHIDPDGSDGPATTFRWLYETRSTDMLRSTIRTYCGAGPYVTGSYIIKTPDGKSKLDGVLWCIEQFMAQSREIKPGCPLDQGELNRHLLRFPLSLQDVWAWLRQFPYMGDFMAYEVVTDLRHTPLLDRADDILTWANPGPGAMRGLNRMQGLPLKERRPKQWYINGMIQLLIESHDPQHWPVDWPRLEMREIEHSLCEFDKYERARLGEGRPRQVLR